MKRVRLVPEAKRDLQEACAYYEDRREGLGEEMMSRFKEAMLRVRLSPESPVVLRDGVRRVSLRQFPYGIIYLVDADGILVLAVSNDFKRPGWWQDRL